MRTLALSIALFAPTAHADSPTSYAPGDHEYVGERDPQRTNHEADVALVATDHDHQPRWQAELGMFGGTARLDGIATAMSPGATLATGVRLGAFTALADYSLAAMTYTGPFTDELAHGDLPLADAHGLAHRLGAAARYAFLQLRNEQHTSELWLEGGLGEQVVAWDRGGTFARPDLSIGLAAQASLRSSDYRRDGVYVAVRVHFGHRTDSGPPTCSAPCSEPSPPAAWSDRSVTLHVAYVFGH